MENETLQDIFLREDKEKLTKKELNKLLEWAENEVMEWQQFIRDVKKKISQ